MTQKIAVLPGDGIGPEIVAEAIKDLNQQPLLALKSKPLLIVGIRWLDAN
jgi:isocitrate/isopropylmalate dehydrogenase